MSKILIVDDQASVTKLLSDLFTGQGHEVITGANGQEAIDLAGEHQPELIVLDLMMPVKTGLDAAREIRDIDALKETPIVFLTARGQAEDEARAREAGATEFVTKPFSPRKFMEIIQKLGLS